MSSDRKAEQRANAQLAQDYKDVFDTPQGRRVLADIMANGHVYAPIYSNNPTEMAYRCGERNTALRIATMRGYKPADFVEKAIETTRELEELFNESRRAAFHYPH